jgi:hypothetical protein
VPFDTEIKIIYPHGPTAAHGQREQSLAQSWNGANAL